MNQDRPVLGIFLMLGFCLTAPLADALAKLLGDKIDIAQLVAFRMGLQARHASGHAAKPGSGGLARAFAVGRCGGFRGFHAGDPAPCQIG